MSVATRRAHRPQPDARAQGAGAADGPAPNPDPNPDPNPNPDPSPNPNRNPSPTPPPNPGEVAIKKGSSVHSDTDLNDLHHEVTLLAGCSHPHLLPLLGHCLSREAACLVF